MEILGTCSTFSKLSFVSSIISLSVTLNGDLSPIRIGGPFHASNEEYTSFLDSMWCDAPKSMIQALGEELMAIKTWLELPLWGF
jgi:hypothetical protein